MGHQSLPHASPMACSMLPVTLWVTFWMEICSPPSSLEETCAHTLQPNIQFALIFQTKSQTTHRQTYGSKVTLGFTSLRRGLRSCCQIHKTFVCSTALFHCLNPSSICSGGDHSGSWSSKCCPTAEAFLQCTAVQDLLLLLHHTALSWKSPVHMPSIFCGHAQHSKEKLKDLVLLPTAGFHRQEDILGCLTFNAHPVPRMLVLQSKSCSIIQIYVSVLYNICVATSGLYLHMQAMQTGE